MLCFLWVLGRSLFCRPWISPPEIIKPNRNIFFWCFFFSNRWFCVPRMLLTEIFPDSQSYFSSKLSNRFLLRRSPSSTAVCFFCIFSDKFIAASFQTLDSRLFPKCLRCPNSQMPNIMEFSRTFNAFCSEQLTGFLPARLQ